MSLAKFASGLLGGSRGLNSFSNFANNFLIKKIPRRLFQKYPPGIFGFKLKRSERIKGRMIQHWKWFILKPKAKYKFAEKGAKEGRPIALARLREEAAKIKSTVWANKKERAIAIGKAVNWAAEEISRRIRYYAPRSKLIHQAGPNFKYGPLRDSVRVEKASRYKGQTGTRITSGWQGSVVVVHAFYGRAVNSGKQLKESGLIDLKLKRPKKKRFKDLA